MAIDKAIDSTKLNACCTAEANAIRAKTGGSSQLAYDYANSKGFADAIAAIPTGGGSDIPAKVGDGKTYIYIDFPEDTPSTRRTFYVRFTGTVSNGVTIDWGDGTTETVGSTTATDYPHTYTSTGKFTIKLTVNSGTISFDGVSGISGSAIFGAIQIYHNRYRIYAIEIGDNVTSIGECGVEYCYNLKSVIISGNVESVGSNAFYADYYLQNVTLPNSLTSIGNSAFGNCYSMRSITVPANVTSIGTLVFAYWYDATEYHFQSTTPPTLASSNAFSGIPSDCVIYVPYSADHSIRNAYKTATNWSNYSSYIREEPQ